MSGYENLYIRKWSAFILLFFIVILVYSNTFHASWHLDDFPNILHNEKVHPTGLNAKSLFLSFFAKPDNNPNIYRPIAMLSLALNWYAGQDHVFGYHLVNILVHAASAFFLFLTLADLMRSPNIRGKYQANSFFIALLAAALWACHPIQTQAVTYIVQRMASMAGLFYISGLLCYVRGRLHATRQLRVGYFLGCFICFLLAIGSKENAFVMPLAIFLIETIFFQNLAKARVRRRLVLFVMVCGVAMLAGGVLIFLDGRPFSFLHAYASRPFTLFERLLSAPRVFLFYLFQIFYPVPGQFSLVHHFTPSAGLFTPWTTAPAMIAVCFMIAWAVRQMGRYPVLSFGILFYVLNHLIESTFIPLEMVFEHRNYLPSMFLFFPIAAGVKRTIDSLREKRSPVLFMVITTTTIVLTALGYGTYMRNQVWSSREAMLDDLLKKSPQDIRTQRELALYLMDHGKLDQALSVYQKVLKGKGYHLTYTTVSTWINLGNIYQKKGEFEKALEYYNQVLKIYPDYQMAYYNQTLAYVRMGRWTDAFRTVDVLTRKNPNHEEYWNLKGLILIRMEKYEEAVSCLRQALQITPDHRNAFLNMGVALNLSHKHQAAARILRKVYREQPADMTVLFYLIENRLRSGEEEIAERYADELLSRWSLAEIRSMLKQISVNNLSAPVSVQLMEPFIDEQVVKISNSLSKNLESP